MIQDLISFRKQLHQFPELSGFEDKTVRLLIDFLGEDHSTDLIPGIGGTGLAVIFSFKEPGPTVAIRCELDALPIDEANLFPHRSMNSGVSHKCGHDGHMAIIVGVGRLLQREPRAKGRVILLFQPAEEIGQGAKKMLEDERMKKLNIQYIFALHNIPGIPIHQILSFEQSFSAEVISMVVKFKGQTCHASEPEKGINPAKAISELIDILEQFNRSSEVSEDFSILTPICCKMGQTDYGISPGDGELHYTMRTWTQDTMRALQQKINRAIAEVGHRHQLQYDIQWLEYFPASKNDPFCNDIIQKAAIQNQFQLVNRQTPFRFGEDFGWFGNHYKCAMFGLGAGISTPPLHNMEYDFPDEIIPTGVAMFTSIIDLLLG